jgi:hypothetical protein
MTLAYVENAIARCAFDPGVKTRLAAALPWLSQALADTFPGDELFTVGCASPRGAYVFATNNLPLLTNADAVDLSTVAAVLHRTIEYPSQDRPGDIILKCMSLLLGPEGLKNLTHDWTALAQDGLTPLIVILSSLQGSSVSMLCTVTALPPPSYTVH